ncbi:hypothetical protein L5515_009647 [Caenorhabditis briggsae]|uniref:F-box domain-containing protein n=1 Tax=Caenorhabditis briggsae TaxID=6238 RepID=A0AAE9JNB0_CAEBR|nr:hypothetical protein L5515_009647 [Caenorhabditis briggsae]
MSNLLEIPDDVMRIILEKSDYFGIQSLRKTCHHLRNFIDDVLPSPNTVSLGINEIRNSEQWKNAKIAEIYRFDIWSPSIFSNFEKSKGYCIDLAPEDVALLKEKFLGNPNFKKCKIHYQRLENGVFEAIGENPRIGSDDFGEKRIWLLDTVDPDKILRIEHSEEQILRDLLDLF